MAALHRFTCLAAAALAVASPTRASAQTDANPQVVELQARIAELEAQKLRLDSALSRSSIDLPTAVTDVDVVERDDHAFFRVSLNTSVARVRVRVHNPQTGARVEATSNQFLRVHPWIRVDGLAPDAQHYAEVIVINNNTAATESNVVRHGRQGVTAGVYDTDLQFRTMRRIAAPTVDRPTGGHMVTHTSISVPVRATEPVVFRGELFSRDPQTGALEFRRVAQFGSDFPVDSVGVPLVPTADFVTMDTVTFPNLAPGTTYDYRIIAMNQQGKRDTLTSGRGLQMASTNAAPPAFALDSAVDIRIQPTNGLVVTWGATDPATNPRVTVEFTPALRFQADASPVAGQRNRYRAVVPVTQLSSALSLPDSVKPTITISMMGPRNESVAVPFTFAVELPANRSAIAQSSLGQPEKEALTRVWERIQEGAGKIRWKDVGVMTMKLVGTAAMVM